MEAENSLNMRTMTAMVTESVKFEPDEDLSTEKLRTEQLLYERSILPHIDHCFRSFVQGMGNKAEDRLQEMDQIIMERFARVYIRLG
jgi:hypothetical protein